MGNEYRRKQQRGLRKLSGSQGFTLAEMLIVVGITAVLLALAVLSVVGYMRPLAQVERDGLAKEILVAAQNHLTVAKGDGYAGVAADKFGVKEPVASGATDYDIYYFVVSYDETATDPVTTITYSADGSVSTNAQTDDGIFSKILPAASLDDGVRVKGNYVVRYQKSSGMVLDVFYCTADDGRAEYNHVISAGNNEYQRLLDLRDTEEESHKAERRTYTSYDNSCNAVLGWSTNDGAIEFGAQLQIPSISKIDNAERLTVTVEDPNAANPDAVLRLLVKGEDSKAERTITLNKANANPDADRIKYKDNGASSVTYTVTLDDITGKGLHFTNLSQSTGRFFPGENITVQAVALSPSKLTNITYSAEHTENSLFGGVEKAAASSGTKEIALISNIRHLENLNPQLSNVNSGLGNGSISNTIRIKQAKQTSDLIWLDEDDATKDFVSEIKDQKPAVAKVSVYKFDQSSNTGVATEDHFYPVKITGTFSYDGQNHSITGVQIDDAENAGLFRELGSQTNPASIQNLECIDFDVQAGKHAGAIAAQMTNAKLDNVLVRNSSAEKETLIKALSGDAGGLIGHLIGGEIKYSAASVQVEGSDSAGGLVGAVESLSGVPLKFYGCYAGGHWNNAVYFMQNSGDRADLKTNVQGGTEYAGGLIGNAEGAEIDTCYAAVIVNGRKAGGFTGRATGTVKNSYSISLVSGQNTVYAFKAEGNATLANNYYLMTVNEEDKDTFWNYRDPYSSYSVKNDSAKIKAIDESTEAFKDFCLDYDHWGNAFPYDVMLVKYYKGKFPYRTIDHLQELVKEKTPGDANEMDEATLREKEYFVIAHYGDWPAPDIFTINH